MNSVLLHIRPIYICNICINHEVKLIDLTFVGPCIVIHFYSKTNQMHNISNLFYFRTTLYVFRTVFPSIIRSLRLYIQHQVYVILKFQKWVQLLVSSNRSPTRCNNFSVYYPDVNYSSTYFGRSPAHHQEFNDSSSSLWFYRWSVVVAVLLVVVGPVVNRPDHDQQHCHHHAPTVKPEATTAVVEPLMMGARTTDTC